MNGTPLLHKFKAMNSQVELKLVCSKTDMDHAVLLAEEWFAKTESIFSRFRHSSELESINRAGGAPVMISSMMMEVLQLAETCRQKTGGLCSPYVGQWLLDAGYSSSFEQLQAASCGRGSGEPSTETTNRAPGQVEHREFQSCMTLNMTMVSVQLKADIRLDLGGFVKSWTASQLAKWLRTGYGIRTGLVNAGGDLLAWQPADESPLWRISVPVPYEPEREIASCVIGNGAVATSGSWRRQWRTSEGDQHHLIDPRSGKPAVSDVIQCSVAGPDLTECEVWAKSICIAGEEPGLRLMQERAPQYEAVVVDRSGGVRAYGNGWLL